jgi:hypothetical protein
MAGRKPAIHWRETAEELSARYRAERNVHIARRLQARVNGSLRQQALSESPPARWKSGLPGTARVVSARLCGASVGACGCRLGSGWQDLPGMPPRSAEAVE